MELYEKYKNYFIDYSTKDIIIVSSIVGGVVALTAVQAQNIEE